MPPNTLAQLWRRRCRSSSSQAAAILLSKLVVGLACGDAELVAAALHDLRQPAPAGLSGVINCRVETPFGGAAFFPLQAAAASPLPPAVGLAAAERLMELGAAVNVRWRDCSGEHTPLSKALALRNLPLAELLVRHGADPTAALLRTDLLQSSRFDPELVKWLLDRGAGVAAPPLGSGSRGSGCGCGIAPCTPGGAGTSRSRGPLPATAVLLCKLQRELHVSRQLSKLHLAAGVEQERWLLRRSADCLTLLLAAGAAPVGAPGPSSGALAAAAAALEPADWEAVRQAATAPPRWTPESHRRLFPAHFHRAAQEVLRVALRGFTVPVAAEQPSGCEDVACDTNGSSSPPAPPQHTFFLDGHVVLCILKHLAPCSQL